MDCEARVPEQDTDGGAVAEIVDVPIRRVRIRVVTLVGEK
jgi:hypothetical protein